MKKFKIVVIGDIMLDQYIIGQHNRQSPEADIPIVEVSNVKNKLGGAGNVANNLKSLGVDPILISTIGKDENGKILSKILDRSGIENHLIIDNNRKTTAKTRVVDSDFKQFIRIDDESNHNIDAQICNKVCNVINTIRNNHQIDAFIIQDYNKGLISPELIDYVQKMAISLNIKLLVDPKNENFELLSSCDVFKPNFSEIQRYLGNSNLLKNKESLLKCIDTPKLKAKKIFITLAESGIFYKDDKSSGVVPGHNVEHPDVSGAGDTVISVLAILVLLDLKIHRIAKIVNKCGALVCKKKGISTISSTEFEEILNKFD